jgi:EAL domain-containing protein (putative c-di-GMP-specific phosphodiesterase class I)
MTEALARRARMVNELRVALQHEQFRIHLQPQYAWSEGQQALQLLGAEVLVRWDHPQRGLIGPHEFITATEDSGLIHPLGGWVLAQACQILQRWQAQDATRHLQLAVNVSALQFGADPFVEKLTALLENNHLLPGSLHLELTESLAIQDMDDVIQKLQSLRQIGVKLSMDDFGTGQSSLTQLRRLPFHQVKIDQSFVGNLDHDSSDAAVAHTVIVMAHALGLDVIAEGVESIQQLQTLTAMGCLKFQGYLFSPPLACHDFEDLIVHGPHPHGSLVRLAESSRFLPLQ